MYGLVNEAIRTMVTSLFDERAWEKVSASVGAPSRFQPLESYDDSITYDLVGAVAELSGLPPEKVLHEFGRYWISDVAARHYASMLEAAGNRFETMCGNLDHLHEQLRHSFRGYQPPSFRFVKLPDGDFQMDYYSDREGLLPFVEGLLTGLAEHCGQRLEITRVADEDNPVPSKRLTIRLLEE